MDNVNLGNTDNMVMVSINSYIQNRYTRQGNDLTYTFLLISPQNTKIAYTREMKDWDFISKTHVETLNRLEIRLDNPSNILSFIGGSSFIIELELELDQLPGHEHNYIRSPEVQRMNIL